MSRIKNKTLHDIALQVGGSHYPDVGGELLEKYGLDVIQACIDALENTSNKHVYTTFDRDRHESTLEEARTAIKARFDLK